MHLCRSILTSKSWSPFQICNAPWYKKSLCKPFGPNAAAQYKHPQRSNLIARIFLLTAEGQQVLLYLWQMMPLFARGFCHFCHNQVGQLPLASHSAPSANHQTLLHYNWRSIVKPYTKSLWHCGEICMPKVVDSTNNFPQNQSLRKRSSRQHFSSWNRHFKHTAGAWIMWDPDWKDSRVSRLLLQFLKILLLRMAMWLLDQRQGRRFYSQTYYFSFLLFNPEQ
jgi:hypothetical protein